MENVYSQFFRLIFFYMSLYFCFVFDLYRLDLNYCSLRNSIADLAPIWGTYQPTTKLTAFLCQHGPLGTAHTRPIGYQNFPQGQLARMNIFYFDLTFTYINFVLLLAHSIDQYLFKLELICLEKNESNIKARTLKLSQFIIRQKIEIISKNMWKAWFTTSLAVFMQWQINRACLTRHPFTYLQPRTCRHDIRG